MGGERRCHGPSARLPAGGWVLLVSALALGAGPRESVEEGNRLYAQGDLDGALQRYTEAQVDLPDSMVLHYNIGNVLYRKGEFPQALEEYRSALASGDEELALRARFNMGNAHFRAQEFGKAAEDYREVLRRDPDDLDAKRNLELALQALQAQPPQSSPSSSDETGEEPPQGSPSPSSAPDPEGDEPPSEDSAQESSPAQEPREDGEGEPSPHREDGSPQGSPSPRPETAPDAPLSVQEANRILDALRQQEKENMKKAFQLPRRGTGTGKDW